MPGFGDGPFGQGGWGEWPWSLLSFVKGVPAVYIQADEQQGGGTLRALLEGVAPSLDFLRRRVRDYDILRDPLLCPTEADFLRPVTVLKTENVGDGTSRVFIGCGPDRDKIVGIKPGMTLLDLRGLRFVICAVVSSARARDVEDPPIDPDTGEPSGKHFVVQNIAQATTELIPFASGTLVLFENPITFCENKIVPIINLLVPSINNIKLVSSVEVLFLTAKSIGLLISCEDNKDIFSESVTCCRVS